jgi:glycosyltransferase involved in cell wall biosynthesis
MMRMCFVCSDYPPGPHGGIGTMTQLLARALVRRGAAVRVIGIYPPDYPADDLSDDLGVQVVRIRERRHPLGWVIARARLARIVARWARRREVDLVEIPDWRGWAAGWPPLPVPVVARLNGSATYFAAERGISASRLTRGLERSSLRRADFVCSASQYTADRTRQVLSLSENQPAIPVLHNPVEVHDRPSYARKGQRVVFTGTLTEKKGVIPLVRAWLHVAAKAPAAELHLFGKDGGTREGGSMEARLRGMLPESTRRSVRFHGHVPRDHLLRVLATARVAVFPSYAEAFALAPLEAMACGCPTISSSRGSGPELIRDGVDGLLVDPDQPDEIAAAILRMLCQDELAEALGAAGRRRVVEEFSIEAMVDRNEAFYGQCMAAFGSRRGKVS